MLTRYLANSLLLLTFVSSAAAQHHPRDKEIHDPDTRAWWHTTEALSNDSMEGRDTGSAAYQRAAEYVAKRFEAAGLKPAGENGGYFQTVPMHDVAMVPGGTTFTVERPGGNLSLPFLQEISVTAGKYSVDHLEGALTFRGYCGKDAMDGVAGKFVVCYGARRTGLPTAAERTANARAGEALGILNVDDLAFTLEPARWPDAYARSITLQADDAKGSQPNPRSEPRTFLSMRLSSLAFSKLVASPGHEPGTFFMAAAAKLPLPSFDIPGKMVVHIKTAERNLSSPNVLAVLRGTDDTLKDEYVIASAHLDGYGFGTPVNGDNLYNGTLDDAAYVALLIQMADDIKTGKLPKPKRSILFCAFTGEEKGLLGSNWFVAHPTVPIAQMAADINLDQLRPLFPLTILTAPGLKNTTLGATASELGAKMGIELRDDHEPERGLLRRADNFPFLRAGVPAIGFIFGYDPGTDAEKRYREWYQVRYHRPQDDLTQPMDFDAATKFNTFFYRLVGTVADTAERPRMIHSVGQ